MSDATSLPWARPRWSLALLLIVAVAVRLAQLDVGAQVDEVYHVLAALSWLEEGSFAVGDGSYTRASGFTVLVAGALKVLGDSLVAARVPALLFGVAWVGLVFEWTRREVGLAAAWAAGLLFAFDPGAVHLAQFVRFYTLHGLLFWVGAAGVYWLATRPGPPAPDGGRGRARKVVVGVAAAVTLGASYYLQPVAAIGTAALLAWLAGRFVLSGEGGPRRILRRGLLVAAIAAVAASLASFTGLLGDAWTLYRTAADWAQYRAEQWRFYHWWLEGRFPVLWRLYPMAVIVAVARRRRVAVFCAVMFVVPLLIHSFAASKHERYLYYAMPFFFVVWGIVAAGLLSALGGAARRVWDQTPLPMPEGRWRRGIAACTVAAVLAFPIYTSPAFKTTAKMVLQDGIERPYGQPEWKAAAPELRERAEGKETVLASRAVKAMYYLGRADAEVIVDPPVSWVLEPVRGFRVDGRIGRPVLSSVSELAAFLECHRSGLAVIERPRWEGMESDGDGALTRTLRSASEAVPVPGEWGLVVREWSGRSEPSDRDCASVRALTARWGSVAPSSAGQRP